MAVNMFDAGEMKGKDGVTPIIDPASGNWIVDGQDSGISARGLPGATGPAGPIGLSGTPGTPGQKGDKGDKGDSGPVGPVGPAGPQGNTGQPGQTGPKGDTGPVGATGATGPTGPQGPKGDMPTNHEVLSNRTIPDQHSIGAITGLDAALSDIETDINGINNTISAIQNTISADETAFDEHLADNSNPHQVSLQQVADKQNTTPTTIPGTLYEGAVVPDNKLLTRAEVMASIPSSTHYKGQLKFGAMTIADRDRIPTVPGTGVAYLQPGDKCEVRSEQLTYTWDGSTFTADPHNPDVVGDMYILLFWYGTWSDGITYNGEVSAEIICKEATAPDFDLTVYSNTLLDNTVTDPKIGTRTLTDEAGVNAEPSVTNPQSLTAWLQSIRNSIKGAFAQIANKPDKSGVVLKSGGGAYDVYSQADIEAIPKWNNDLVINVMANFTANFYGFNVGTLRIIFYSDCTIGTLAYNNNRTLLIANGYTVTFNPGDYVSTGYVQLRGSPGKFIFTNECTFDGASVIHILDQEFGLSGTINFYNGASCCLSKTANPGELIRIRPRAGGTLYISANVSSAANNGFVFMQQEGVVVDNRPSHPYETFGRSSFIPVPNLDDAFYTMKDEADHNYRQFPIKNGLAAADNDVFVWETTRDCFLNLSFWTDVTLGSNGGYVHFRFSFPPNPSVNKMISLSYPANINGTYAPNFTAVPGLIPMMIPKGTRISYGVNLAPLMSGFFALRAYGILNIDRSF